MLLNRRTFALSCFATTLVSGAGRAFAQAQKLRVGSLKIASPAGEHAVRPGRVGADTVRNLILRASPRTRISNEAPDDVYLDIGSCRVLC